MADNSHMEHVVLSELRMHNDDRAHDDAEYHKARMDALKGEHLTLRERLIVTLAGNPAMIDTITDTSGIAHKIIDASAVVRCSDAILAAMNDKKSE